MAAAGRGRPGPACHYRSPDGDRQRTEADVVVVGAGAAGLYAALSRRARRSARRARLGDAARRVGQLLGAGRARRRARPRGLARAPPTRTPSPPAAAPCGRSAARVLSRRGARRARATSRSSASTSTPTVDGTLALGLEGGHSVRRIVHAGGSATGRRITRELSALVAQEPRIDVLEDHRVTGLLVAPDDGRCVGARHRRRRWRSPRGRSSSPPAAPPRCGRRTTNPPGTIGSGCCSPTRPAPRSPTSSSCSSTRPPWPPADELGGRRSTASSSPRRSAARARASLDADGERFVDELAPRDEVARAIQVRMRETGARAALLDMRAVDPTLFPNVVAALRDAGLEPDAAS